MSDEPFEPRYIEPQPGYYAIRVPAWVYPKAFEAGWGYSFCDKLREFINDSEVLNCANWVDDLCDGYYDLGFIDKDRCLEFIALLEEYRA